MPRMLVHLRSFITVVEEGSLHRAAERLHLSQSTLSRQMQALESELGGQLLERTSIGVRPTNGGHALAAKAGALLASYETTIVEVRRLLRGESKQLRIGYVGSAAHDYLNPAQASPNLSGRQIAAARSFARRANHRAPPRRD